MKDEPAVAYEGGVSGIPGTKPAKGKKFAAKSDAVAKYRGYLRNKQNKAIAKAGVDATKYRYTDAVSGFAADLSVAEATALSKDASVLAVTQDEVYQLDTNASPEFLGLTGANGVWDQLGGTTDTRKGAGAGTVVGIIDSGIWPENPSFAGDGFPAPQDWNGGCMRGPHFNPNKLCNNKLIGAKYFLEGFGKKNLAKYEWVSPRDADGHGTHTASTAAGNDGVDAVIEGRNFGQIAGMAPQAHIAAYKVCWDGKDGAGCSAPTPWLPSTRPSPTVSTYNFSISGTSNNYLDAVELAFMNAAKPASSWPRRPATAAHRVDDEPPVAVADDRGGLHAHDLEKTLETGDGQRFIGSSIITDLPTQTPMVLRDAMRRPVGTDALLCAPNRSTPPRLPEARGLRPRRLRPRGEVDRGQARRRCRHGAGQPVEGSLDTDLHAVPRCTCRTSDRAAVRAYAATTGPTGADPRQPTPASTTRSRDRGLLQPRSVPGRRWRHPQAGHLGPRCRRPPRRTRRGTRPQLRLPLGDLDVVAAHRRPRCAAHRRSPTWSPMAMKSAMMTTARDHASAHDVFATGAGFVKPREFLDPGLVYDADQDDWWCVPRRPGRHVLRRLARLRHPDRRLGPQPGVHRDRLARRQADSDADGHQRRLDEATYTASVSGLDGVATVVTPSSLTVAPGQSKTFTVEFTRSTAPFNSYAQGHLTWSDGGAHSVRSPIAVRPVAAAVPAEVTVQNGQSTTVNVVSGFSGTMTTQVKGLTAGTVTPQTAQNTGGPSRPG